jgi:hypothetical protein
MLTQVAQFKSLTEKQQQMLPSILQGNQMVYLIKDVTGQVRSITTDILTAISKTQLDYPRSSAAK